MPIIDYRAVVNTLQTEVGYQGEHYNSKFTQFLDSIFWYNGKKAGACTWCAILVDYAIAVNKGDLTYEQARQITCEPANHNYNAGAGVKEKAGYFKSAGRWIVSVKNATTGYQIFLNGLNHVGTVTGWDSSGLYYIDGSTTYNGKPYSVGKKHISFSAGNIDGFGRPDWYKFQSSDDNNDKPVDKEYTVSVSSYLSMRNSPTTSAKEMGRLFNGAKVSIIEEKNGWARVTGGLWVSKTYLR